MTVDKQRSIVWLVVIVYSILFMIGVGIIYFFQEKGSVVKAFSLPVDWAKPMGIGLLTGLLVTGITILTGRFKWSKRLEAEFRSALGRLNIGQIIIIALMSGIAEEVFFRGGIQPLIGLVPTSLIFGILHFPVNRSLLPWTIFAVLMGFLLGELYIATNCLWVPIITHVMVNCLNLYRICRWPVSRDGCIG